MFVYPTWWGTMPALLKGFIDKVFQPGFGFQYRNGSVWWDKLLKGRSARLIVTMDTPPLYFRWVYGRPGHNAMKKKILGFYLIVNLWKARHPNSDSGNLPS